ncbi:MAG: DUF4304 domain-containing protein [Proteobacteria bacterium]|nr:DUF4304 domain-containing protein [Pseudomonadota bacterium]
MKKQRSIPYNLSRRVARLPARHAPVSALGRREKALSINDTFCDSVQAVITPRLINVGFRHRGRLLFSRSNGRFTQVIEFVAPPGDGRFAVRLGVHMPFAPDVDGDTLPQTLPPHVTRCHVRASLGRILQGRDHLWTASPEWDETYRQMRDALRGILHHGLCWLAQCCEPDLLIRHFERAAERPCGHGSPAHLPAAVVVGLLHESRERWEEAACWYRQSLQGRTFLTPGLREWVYNRLHNLPVR